jgi:hypothetical protein
MLGLELLQIESPATVNQRGYALFLQINAPWDMLTRKEVIPKPYATN